MFFVDVVAVAPAIILIEIEARSGLGFPVVGSIIGARARIAFKPGHFGLQGIHVCLCVDLSYVVLVAKASLRVLFVFVKANTALQSEAVAVARFASASAVWVWISLKVTELAV